MNGAIEHVPTDAMLGLVLLVVRVLNTISQNLKIMQQSSHEILGFARHNT